MESKKRGRKPKTEDYYNSVFASRLRALINNEGITLPKLAKSIGATRQSIGQWKDGKAQPNATMIKKIAEYFNVSSDYLLGLSEYMVARTTDKLLDFFAEETEKMIDKMLKELEEISTSKNGGAKTTDDEHENCYKNVYICSPYRGCTLTNEAAARRFCKWAIQQKGVMPLAPHIYFTQFFDDNASDERQSGMNMGIKWLRQCSEIWVLGESLSEGMVYEISEASRLGIPIRFFLENNDEFVERGEKK